MQPFVVMKENILLIYFVLDTGIIYNRHFKCTTQISEKQDIEKMSINSTCLAKKMSPW